MPSSKCVRSMALSSGARQAVGMAAGWVVVAASGPLDEMALYYLRSRGLSPDMAAGMLTYGFAAEIVGRMEHAGLRAELDGLVRARLAERSGGGRRA